MSSSALAGFLATVLLHSTLWIAAAWVLARALRSAVWRARLWRGAALGGVASAALALALDTSRLEWRWEPPRPAAARMIAIDAPADAVAVSLEAARSGGERGPAPASSAPVPEAPASADWSWTSLAAGAWALGAALALASLARDRRRLALALRARRTLRERSWCADLRELTRRAGLRRAPRLTRAEALCSPLALARGEVVVPARALSGLARDEQRALLAHELAHLSRRDPHWLLALSLLERLFWFQPLLRAAGRRAGAAAELCCDEAAAHWTGAALALARCLAAVASWVGARADERVAVAMAARGSALVERVERLLAPPPVARFQGALCVTSGALLLAALACSGPTAGERESAREQQQMDFLRSRIDPDGTKELQLEPLGGGRFVISMPVLFGMDERRADPQEGDPLVGLAELGYAAGASPPGQPPSVRHPDERVELGWILWNGAFVRPGAFELVVRAKDRRLDGPLELVRSCPEARIAFHVPFVDGAYARTMTAPGGEEHALELRADGSIWCGQMPLLLSGSGDWRLVDLHLEEFARCAGNMTRMTVAADTVVVIEGFELRIDDAVDYGILLQALESCARDSVRIRSFRFVRVADGAAGAPLQVRLPASGPESAPVEPLRVALYAPDEPGQERRVVTALSGAGAGAGYHTDSLEALAHELARLRADAVRFGTAVVDAQSGVSYGDLAPVLEALVEAGYTDLRFAARR